MITSDQPIHIIINPRSGHGGRKRILGELRAEIRRGGWDLVEYVTKYAGDATRRACEVADDASLVIAWGGDGTANEVGNGLLGRNTPLLVLPAGTENLLAKELRIPRKPVDIVNVLHTGRIMNCDMGLINGQSFHSILGVGFDAEVVRRLSSIRTGHISHLTYFWPIWRTFWEHDFPQMRVVADGQEVFEGRGLAFVGNISRYSSGLRVCRNARFDDGLLDLVVFRCNEQAGLILHAAWTLLRLHPLKGNVVYHQARSVRIETQDTLTSQVDGDIGPATPLDISLAPDKIKMLVPAKSSRWALGPLWPWKGDAPL